MGSTGPRLVGWLSGVWSSFCFCPPHPSPQEMQAPGRRAVAVLCSPLWRHLTPGVPCRGLPTDRYMWSDATGLQECTKASTKPPSLQWTWVSSGLGVGQRLQ